MITPTKLAPRLVALLLTAGACLAETVQVSPDQKDNPSEYYDQAQITSDGRWIVYGRSAEGGLFTFGLFAIEREKIGTDGAVQLTSDTSFEPSIADGVSAVAYTQAGLVENGVLSNLSAILIIDPMGESPNRVNLTDAVATYPGVESVSQTSSPELTPDASKVVFTANVVFTEDVYNDADPNHFPAGQQVFLYDTATQQVECITRNSQQEFADGNCIEPTIADDGNQIAFLSEAHNLVADAGDGMDLYLKNRLSPIFTKLANSYTNSGSPTFQHPSISGSGSYVVFISEDVVHGGASGEPQLVRCPGNQVITPLGASLGFQYPKISFTGDKIAFYSLRSDLVQGDMNQGPDAFVWSASSGSNGSAFLRVSVKADGSDAQTGYHASFLDITADGEFVVFTSSSQDLTPTSAFPQSEIFLGDGRGFSAPAARIGGNGNSGGEGNIDSNPAVIGSELEPATFVTEAPVRIGLPIHYVDVSTLDLILRGTLFSMSTRGPDLDVAVQYSGAATSDGILGKKWRLSYDSRCVVVGTNVRLERGSGQVLEFAGRLDLNEDPLVVSPVVLASPPGVSQQLLMEVTVGEIRLINLKNHEIQVFDRLLSAGFAYLTRIIDRNGNTISINRDASNPVRINSIAGPAGRVLTFQYDNAQNNLLSRIQVPDGRTMQFHYDTSRWLLTRITDMAGYIASYTYDSNGNLIHIQTGTGTEARKSTFSYLRRSVAAGSGFRIQHVYERDLDPVTYTPIDGPVRKVRRSSRGQRSHTYTFDGELNLTGIESPLGGTRSLEYVASLPTRMSDANGNIRSARYNAFGFPIEVVSPLNETTRYHYLGDTGFVTKVEVPSATVPPPAWSFTYDSHRNLTSSTSPLGNTTTFTYDTFGQLLAVKEPGAVKSTVYTYDNYGNVRTAKRPDDSAAQVYEYDAHGLRCTKVTDPRGNVRTFTYDNDDRIISSTSGTTPGTDPTITMTWDPFNQRTLTNELGKTTTFDYNLFGHPLKITPPLANTTSSRYDIDNRLLALTDPLGRTTSYEYDDDGRIKTVTHPQGTETRDYDKEGHLVSHTTPNGGLTTFVYDKNGNLTSRDDSASAPVSYEYDKRQRVIAVINGRGQTLATAFDDDSRLVSRTFPDRGTISYGHDARGNVISETVPGLGTTFYDYDDNNRVTQIRFPNPSGNGTLNVTYAYFGTGEVSQIIYPDGTTVNCTWTSRSSASLPAGLYNGSARETPKPELGCRLASLSWGGGNSASFSYDGANRLTGIARANGVGSTYSYDNNDRIVSIQHTATSEGVGSISYSYNPDNSSASRTTGDLPPFSLPDSSESATFDSSNRIIGGSYGVFSYDADGNATGGYGGTFSATYTSDNRVSSLTRNGATTNFLYDANDRAARVVSPEETRYLFRDRGGRVLFETDGDGAVVDIDIYRDGYLFARGSQSAGFRYYHFDRNGNTVAITSASDGSVLGRYDYLPYGGISSSGSPGPNPYTFAAEHGIREVGNGFLLMGHRMYDTASGRFLHQDPIGLRGGNNPYVYAVSNPVDFIDSSGEFAISGTAAAVWAIAAAGGWFLYQLKKGSDKGKANRKADKDRADNSGGEYTPEDADARQEVGKDVTQTGGDLGKAGLGLYGAASSAITGGIRPPRGGFGSKKHRTPVDPNAILEVEKNNAGASQGPSYFSGSIDWPYPFAY